MSKDFSERLMSLRKTRKKAEFARELGIPAPMYHRYENGQIPQYDNLKVIADKCGVTVEWLLTGHDKHVMTRDDLPPETAADPYIRVVMNKPGYDLAPSERILQHAYQSCKIADKSGFTAQLETLFMHLHHFLAGEQKDWSLEQIQLILDKLDKKTQKGAQ